MTRPFTTFFSKGSSICLAAECDPVKEFMAAYMNKNTWSGTRSMGDQAPQPGYEHFYFVNSISIVREV